MGKGMMSHLLLVHGLLLLLCRLLRFPHLLLIVAHGGMKGPLQRTELCLSLELFVCRLCVFEQGGSEEDNCPSGLPRKKSAGTAMPRLASSGSLQTFTTAATQGCAQAMCLQGAPLTMIPANR